MLGDRIALQQMIFCFPLFTICLCSLTIPAVFFFIFSCLTYSYFILPFLVLTFSFSFFPFLIYYIFLTLYLTLLLSITLIVHDFPICSSSLLFLHWLFFFVARSALKQFYLQIRSCNRLCGFLIPCFYH